MSNEHADAAAPGDEHWRRDWGQFLRVARQVAGLSLGELSARSGLSKGYLSKLESGYASARNPSRATLAALARALPSFGPLAHMLEPAAPTGVVALGPTVPTVLDGSALGADADEQRSNALPVQLGWRELEVLVALLALERAAAAVPLSALTLARATDRPLAAVRVALDGLLRMGILERTPPTRIGAPAGLRRAADFEARVGLGRLGDALVLAAALLAQAPTRRTPPSSQPSHDEKPRVAEGSRE